jgi:glycosyltransferase involved in cell wall biosynthesis
VVIAFGAPGSLDQPTGGYAYDRRVIAELRRSGCAVEVIDLGEGFPYRTEPSADAAARLHALPEGTPIIIDGLALGALPHTVSELQRRHPVIALVHHPLALETGLSAPAAAAFRASERSALAATRHVIVTGGATARLLVADYDVAASAITIAVPGNDRVAPNPIRPTGPINLLAVGALVPRKGYDVLVEALARLVDLDWQLVIAGDCTRDREVAGAIATRVVLLRLSPRLRLAGAVDDDELGRLYREADMFVLSTRHEGYGMAFAEAIAHGLPIVGTRVGAIPETVPEGAGILVPPDDVGALAAALRTMISDREQRAACAQASRRAATQLPGWEGTALAILDAIRALT